MLTGILAGLAAGALWGLVFVAPRMVPGIGAVDFSAGRFVSYGLLSLTLLLLAHKTAWPTWAQARAALIMSVLGFTGYYLLLVLGIRDAGTEVPSLIIGTIPLWMMMLGKPAAVSWKSLIPGLLLTGAGLVLMMHASHGAATNTTNAVVQVGQGDHFWRGVAYSVASMACWTAFGLMNAKWLKDHPEVSATTWANWLGVATGMGALIVWLFLGSEPKVLFAQKEIALAAMLAIATGIGSAWVATLLWNIASQRLSASLCGQLIVSETIFALIYSFIWDGQLPSLVQFFASALFVAGILASIRAHR